MIGAIQVSDFEDPTPREVAELIEQVEAAGVPAIFGSEVFPSPVLEQIGREAGVEYVDVLRDDDLPGEPGDAEHSWLGLMLFDYITITDGARRRRRGAARTSRCATSLRTRPGTRNDRRASATPSWSASSGSRAPTGARPCWSTST